MAIDFFRLMETMNKPSYTALVLDEASKAKLLSLFPPPPGYDPIAHHMTINMGGKEKGPAVALIGTTQQMRVVGYGQDERVTAVSVESIVPSTNAIKHVTIGVNRVAGGKPFHSNQLKFEPIASQIPLSGIVQEV